MRKFFTLFLLIIAFVHQSRAGMDGTDIPSKIITETSSVCDQNIPETSEDGLQCGANENWTAANDIIVAAGNDMTLTSITPNLWMTPGITAVSVLVTIYDNNGGLPGTAITSQTVVPTSSTVVGSIGGAFDISEVVIDLAPVSLPGDATIDVVYWIAIQVTNSDNSGAFWSATYATSIGNPSASSSGTGFGIPSTSLDGVYVFSASCEPIGGGGSGCDQNIPETSEDGLQCGANENWTAANDIIVAAGNDMTLTSITPNLWMTPGITTVSVLVTIYDDNGGLPGTAITSQTVVPTSSTVVGSIGGAFDISEVVIDLAPISLAGDAAVDVVYWIAIQVTNSDNSGVFWSATYATSIGNPSASSSGAGFGIPSTSLDGVYVFSASCEPIGGGPTCISTAYNSTAVPFDIDGAGNQTVDCANAPNLIPITINDGGTLGADAFLENITIDITHSYSGDLNLYLVSPNGTELLLAEALGDGTADAYNGTIFEDGGSNISAAMAPFGAGPYESMGGSFAAAFAGEDISGNWHLKVCDDAGGNTGQVLQFSMSFCIPEASGPVNDNCSGAIALACGDSIMGHTLTASNSGGFFTPDVYYSFTGNGSAEFVTISTCTASDFDTVLRVFDDCDLANEITFNNNYCGTQSQIKFLSDGTTTYYIMVEGNFGDPIGNFSLDVACNPVAPNDECEGAIAISCGDSISGTIAYATIDEDEINCYAGVPTPPNVSTPGVWYTLEDTMGVYNEITLSTCSGSNFTSKIAVYTGSCGDLICFDANKEECGAFEQWEVTFTSDGNTTYSILIFSQNTEYGDFTLDVSCTPLPPVNDRIANAINVGLIGYPYTDLNVNMPLATIEDGNPADCDLSGDNGVWYKFRPDVASTVDANIVSPAGESSVTFYTAPHLHPTEDELTLVDQDTNICAPGTSSSITALAGQSYYVFVLNTGGVTDIEINAISLGVSDNALIGFSYYPNPTDGIVNIESVESIDTILLFNILGQAVLENNVNATTSQVDISGLKTGTYFMKVTVNGKSGIYKVLKN